MSARDWPEAVLFDAAGTLIELREGVGETYSRIAREHGVAVPAWRLADAFRRILARAPSRAFPGVAADAIADLERSWWRDVVRSTFLAADSTLRFDDFEAFFRRLFREYDGAVLWRARPHAVETLHALRDAERRLAVVSNFDQRLPRILAELGIADQLGAVVIPAVCGVEKPDPKIFADALTRLAVESSTAVFVGDDPETDAQGAEAAGLVFVDVGTLGSLGELPARLAHLATLAPRPAPLPRSSR